jgi:hypothetical protein
VDDQARKLNEYTRYVADRLKRWVDEKWGADYHCPMCQLGFNAWATHGAMPLPLFGQSDPETLMPMICGNCGYTILIDSHTARILSREEFEDPVRRERLDKARQEQGDDSTA